MILRSPFFSASKRVQFRHFIINDEIGIENDVIEIYNTNKSKC